PAEWTHERADDRTGGCPRRGARSTGHGRGSRRGHASTQRADRRARAAGRAAARDHRAGDGPGPSLVTADADLAFLSARRIAALVRERAVSPVEITRLYLDRIDRLDGELRAYITVVPEAALESARRAEAAVLRGEALGPL